MGKDKGDKKELQQEIAGRLMKINTLQRERWSGITGDEFKKATREAMELVIEVEVLLDREGIQVEAIHKDGLVFKYAYAGELVCGGLERESDETVVEYIEVWVKDELEKYRLK